MFKHKANEALEIRVVAEWFMLAAVAGIINVGGFMACQRFVSHVTGFATLAGVDIASGKVLDALGILTVPFFFLIGVMISALNVDRRIARGEPAHYSLVMGLVTLCLVFAGTGGVLGIWGGFGHTLILSRDYLFLALLCLASGLQNAVLTTATGATLRTTHLTGTTTDLGIGLMRWWSSRDPGVRDHEKKTNLLRIGLITSFVAGSTLGALLFSHIDYLGFVLPASLTLYATLRAR